MKKTIMILMAIIGSHVSGMAQVAPPPVKKQEDKMKTVPAKTVTPAQAVPVTKTVTKAPVAAEKPKPATNTQAVVLKKDGTPDKRYKNSGAAKSPLKKDGTPDKRYKSNKKGR